MDLYPVYHLYIRNIILSSLQAPNVTRSLVQCGILCSKASNCSSFFYNNVNHDCYLVDRFVLAGGIDTEPRNNIAYYVRYVSLCPSMLGFHFESSLNICYKVHWEKLEFNPARAVCQGEGGDLASVKTLQIEIFYITLLTLLISPDGQDMFFGAHDEDRNDEWTWLDGTSCWRTYLKAKAGKDCLEYDYDRQTMDGEFCENKEQGFVCEIVLP